MINSRKLSLNSRSFQAGKQNLLKLNLRFSMSPTSINVYISCKTPFKNSQIVVWDYSDTCTKMLE